MITSIIGPSGMRYYNAEGRTERLLPNIKKTTRLIMSIYMGYMITGTILYYIAGMPFFDSLNHSMAALSTGGFSVKNDSIAFYSSLKIEIVSIILMLLGTTSFAASYLVIKKEFKKFSRIGEMRFKIFLIIV